MAESIIHKKLLTRSKEYFEDCGYDVIDSPKVFHPIVDGEHFSSRGILRPDLLVKRSGVTSFVEVYHNKVACDLCEQIEKYSLHCKNIFLIFSDLHTADKIKGWLEGIVEDHNDVNIFLLSEKDLRRTRRR